MGTLVLQNAIHSLAARILEHLKKYCRLAGAKDVRVLAGLRGGACLWEFEIEQKRSQKPNDALKGCSRPDHSIFENARTGREQTDTGTTSSIRPRFVFPVIQYFALPPQPLEISTILKSTYRTDYNSHPVGADASPAYKMLQMPADGWQARIPYDRFSLSGYFHPAGGPAFGGWISDPSFPAWITSVCNLMCITTQHD